MSKRNKDARVISAFEDEVSDSASRMFSRRSTWMIAGVALVAVLTFGVFAKNGWLPATGPLTGKKTTWFGRPLEKNAASNWNPFAAPLPAPTPKLSREFLYAGSRLLAQVDANAQETPPADLAVWRPSTGGWWVLTGAGAVNQNWGVQDDKPVEGDYDGDGKTDFAVFRPGNNNWYVVHSSTGTTGQFPFGASGDEPAQADFDGDGKTDAAVFRPGTGIGTGSWYIQRSSDSQMAVASFGDSNDITFPADN